MITNDANDSARAGRSVRELGAEIWSAIDVTFGQGQIDWQTKQRIAEVAMGVLARHAGKRIVNDPDMPVSAFE